MYTSTNYIHNIYRRLHLPMNALIGAQNMFSNDVKHVHFRCQTLKFSHPNVKFPRQSLLCNSPSYINKSSSTRIYFSEEVLDAFSALNMSVKGFSQIWCTFLTVMIANDSRGNFTLGWENFKV